MSDKTRVVVLGGGYGGVEATKKLYKKFKKDEDVEITLIDKNPYHTLMTELHEVAGSRTEAESVQVSFAKIFAGKRVNVEIDEIQTIDFHNNKCVSKVNEYPYDYLIIGAGGEPEFFDIPGVQENSFTCWSLEDAIRIRTQVEEMFREAAKEPDPKRRRRLLTFAIAGGGFTGAELAGELLERKEVLCPKYHIAEDEVRIIVIEMMDSILPIFPDHLRRKASRYLRQKGAEIMLNAPITKAEPGKITIGDEETLETDTFIWTAGIHGSEFTSKIELTKGQCASGTETEASTVEGIHGMAGCSFEEEERYVVGERGRILVNDHMQSVDFDNVYMAGDMIWYIHEEKVVPQIVETALQTAEVAAENVAAEIEKKGKKKSFKPNYHGFMVSLGGRYGVAYVLGLSFTGFLAMASKHLINLHYLLGLAGVNAVWEYLQHEFFTIKHRRSFIGGHLAWKIPNYWALPLRIWLGAKWLSEGIKHISEGWISPGEGGIFNPATSSIYLPGVSFGDAGSSASPEWEGGAEAAGEAAGQAAQTASEYGEPLIEALGIWTWFAESVLSASPALAFIMQALVVLAQVAVGLALVGGLFTFLAAGVSIILGLAFIASGWGNPELLWYIFASIVMLGGAGRGFGLDHYVMPWLHNWWNRTRLAQKTYLYVGEPRLKN
jgi:NADH:ubiquinone reductase (H+-translocating)